MEIITPAEFEKIFKEKHSKYFERAFEKINETLKSGERSFSLIKVFYIYDPQSGCRIYNSNHGVNLYFFEKFINKELRKFGWSLSIGPKRFYIN